MWTLKLAWRYLFPQGRCGTFFTWVSVLGICLGVVVLSVVQCVMNGFDKNIQEKLVQLNGDVKVVSSGLVDIAIQDDLKRVRGVEAVSPFVQGVALVQHKQFVQFPKCLGVDLDSIQSVLPLERFVKEGQLQDLKHGIFLTRPLAHALNIKVGDTLDLYSPLSLEAIKQDEIILPQELCVVGILESGWAEFDRDGLVCSLETLQSLYGLQNEVHGFSLKARPATSLKVLTEELNKTLPPSLSAYTWFDFNADFLYVLKLEKTMSFFVLLFIVLVAAFSMSSGLMTSVMRKIREIALLRLWGAKSRHIVAIFFWQACILGILGILLGFTVSGLVLVFRNHIVKFLTGWILPQNLLWDFYSFAELPVAYDWKDFVVIGLVTFVITLFASVLPALRANKFSMSKGLRCE